MSDSSQFLSGAFPFGNNCPKPVPGSTSPPLQLAFGAATSFAGFHSDRYSRPDTSRIGTSFLLPSAIARRPNHDIYTTFHIWMYYRFSR
jgi:hypothetical protein